MIRRHTPREPTTYNVRSSIRLAANVRSRELPTRIWTKRSPAIDPIYTRGIITGAALYQQRTVLDVLEYLYNTYGHITTINLMRNEQEMIKPYEPSQPIMILLSQITDGAAW